MGSKAFQGLLKIIKENTTYFLLELNNDLDEEQLLKLLEALKRNTSVTHLTLNKNMQFSVKIAQAIGKVLEINTSLRHLELSGNNISAEAINCIVLSLRKSSLHTLDLSENAIGTEGATLLAFGLVASQVKVLNVNSNNIGSPGAKALLAILLCRKTQIENLDLGWNNIDAVVSAAFVVVQKELPLVKLNLEGNDIAAKPSPIFDQEAKDNKNFNILSHSPTKSAFTPYLKTKKRKLHTEPSKITLRETEYKPIPFSKILPYLIRYEVLQSLRMKENVPKLTSVLGHAP